MALWRSFPAANLAPDEYVIAPGLYLGAAVLLALMEGVQPPKARRSANLVFALELALLASEVSKLGQVPPGPADALHPPFRGRGIVFHGGASTLINHHASIEAPANALDLLIDMRKSPEPAARLESYTAWGQPLLASAPGRVAAVVSELPDQPIGASDAGGRLRAPKRLPEWEHALMGGSILGETLIF